MELRDWADRYGVVAGVTTRGAGRGFSLGLWSEENVGQVMTRWRALRAAFRPAFPGVVLSHQIHGTAVQWHRAGQDGWLILDGVDGHATRTPGVLLTVTGTVGGGLFALWALFDRLMYGSLGPEDPVDVVVREHTPGVEHVAHGEKTIEVRIDPREVGG